MSIKILLILLLLMCFIGAEMSSSGITPEQLENTEKDLFKAIEKVKEHMAEIIKKYKEKKIDGKRMAKLE